jgi:hypothetical protein
VQIVERRIHHKPIYRRRITRDHRIAQIEPATRLKGGSQRSVVSGTQTCG